MKCCPANWIKVFKSFSDPTRQKILEELGSKGELNVTALQAVLDCSQPTVSHHLKILTEAGVLTSTKRGKEVFFQLDTESISGCCQGMVKKFCKKD